MNDIQEFFNEKDNMKVNVIKDVNGNISMKLEDVARGLGFTKKANSGNIVVRWSRVKDYLIEFGVPTVGNDGFISEQYVYLLAMKANNDVAKAFQMWLAMDVIPSIRKHGAFLSDSEYIDESFVLNELRFSQKRTIKTFANSNVSEIKKLYEEFRDYVDDEYKYKTSDRVARYKSVEKGLQQLQNNLATDPENVGDCFNIKKLKERVIIDRTSLEKKISGGQKAGLTRKINEYEELLENICTD